MAGMRNAGRGTRRIRSVHVPRPASLVPETHPFDPADITSRLLAWYGRKGRDLPWRKTRDPYRIWVSEIMLQQTGVETVIPYYERFLDAFSTVEALASATVEEVVERWAGLGYYSRARNLHAAARKVVSSYSGRFPETLEGLMALPGVGRSTAGAILSIAFNLPAPILDGNVRRVLCRLHALQDDPRSASSEKRLWIWAEELTPEDRPHDYSQAIMDLGATVCTPRVPDCGVCPLEMYCRARALGLENLPLRRGRKKVPTRTQVALLLVSQGCCLVRRRPLSGMLGGLWEFPAVAVADGETPEKAASRLIHDLGFAAAPHPAGEVAHVYSHFRLDLRLYRAEVEQAFKVAEGEESRWLPPSELAAFPLHGAHKKAFALVSDKKSGLEAFS